MRIRDILQEGLFVLKTGLQNTFYPKKIALKNKQEKEHQLLNRSVEPQLTEQQLEFRQAYGLGEEPLEIEL